MRKRLMVSGLALWLALATAQAAVLSGVVEGDGEALAGAEVALVDAASNVALSRVYSGADGEFAFTVEPGTFNVGAFKADYSTRWVKAITVGDDDVAIRLEMTNKAFAEDHSGVAESDCD